MCGICGIVKGSGDTVEQSKIKIMTDSMIHRGPDGEGFLIKENVGFGHRRLSIIDLSANAAQPMSNEDGSICLSFNGEIYNYQEIKKDLVNKHKFVSNSDTEVVIHAYEEWGEACLHKFRGMFAFAIYDFIKGKLFLARDYTGQKPLVYYFNDKENTLYFASEINAILAASKIRKTINKKALHLFFIHNYKHIPEPHTIFEGINKLPPACTLTYDIKTNKIDIKNYWNPDFSKQKKSDNLFTKYLKITEECVNLTEVSDVPVGVLLSGGVDSSTILSLINNKDIKSYTLGLDENDAEFLRARKIARMFGTDHKEIIFNENSFDDVVTLIKYLGEPLNLLPALHLYAIAKEAKKELKVLIGGNGADEIFYGYDGSNRLLLLTYVFRFISFFSRPSCRLRKFVKNSLWLRVLLAPLDKKKGEVYRYYGEILKNTLYSKDFSESLAGFDEGRIIDDYCAKCNSKYFIEKSYYSGLMSENQHAVSIFTDLAGMANSLEIRAPYLDSKMVEFASALPLRLKVKSVLRKKFNKFIMKKSMEKIIPKEILYAKKMGFGYNVKIGDLIRNDWHDRVKDVLFNVVIPSNLFSAEFIREKFEEHNAGLRDNGTLLWGLTTFGIWYKEVYV